MEGGHAKGWYLDHSWSQVGPLRDCWSSGKSEYCSKVVTAKASQVQGLGTDIAERAQKLGLLDSETAITLTKLQQKELLKFRNWWQQHSRNWKRRKLADPKGCCNSELKDSLSSGISECCSSGSIDLWNTGAGANCCNTVGLESESRLD